MVYGACGGTGPNAAGTAADREIRGVGVSEVSRVRPRLDRSFSASERHAISAAGFVVKNYAVCSANPRRAGRRSRKDKEGRGDELCGMGACSFRGETRGCREGVEHTERQATTDGRTGDGSHLCQQPETSG